MAKIQQLSPHVADLIAAGEVVERPASAAKELVENAIDAGAKNIVVEVQNGGMTFLRVTDDGCGMLPEDAETAFLRHATSKLRNERDLEAISTLGFRGEALAAISAVSRIDLITKTNQTPLGISLHLEAGVITEREEAGCPDGTTIIVRDLFYNTPARMKFMKRDSVEAANVVSAVAKLALAHPEIAFRVIKDGHEELSTTGDGELFNAIRAVMGRQCAQELVPLNSHFDKYTLTGYISKPTASRGNRGNQIFFVNGRLVRSKTMCTALETAYANRMMSGRFPQCVLHLRLPEHLVDVNVHPAKIEVKFTNERDIFDCIRYGVEGALDVAPAKVAAQLPVQREKKPFSAEVKAPAPAQTFSRMSAEQYRAFAQSMSQAPVAHAPKELMERFEAIAPKKQEIPQPHSKPVSVPDLPEVPKETAAVPEVPKKTPTLPRKEETEQQSLPIKEKPWRLIGQVMDTYILIEQDHSLLLIDKHAAHERLLFEKLRKNQEPIMPQLLLSPLVLTFGREEAAVLCENETLLQQYGFAVSDYGDGAMAVRQIPSELAAGDVFDTLCELAAELKDGRQRTPNELRDHLLHTIACKAAIKGGRHSDVKELEAIAREVLNREDLKYCPHGRPICVELTQKQLEKQFKR